MLATSRADTLKRGASKLYLSSKKKYETKLAKTITLFQLLF